MVTGPDSVAQGLFGISSMDEGDAIRKVLFQHKDRRLLQMLTEIDPSMSYEMTILSTVTDIFSSNRLKIFAKNYCLWKVAQDRKGRTEAVEISHRGGFGEELED
jgi:hypothetical protein